MTAVPDSPRACLMIAPVCGDCGREIDKDDHGQWWHVTDPKPRYGQPGLTMDELVEAHRRSLWRRP